MAVINSSSFAGTANNSLHLGGNLANTFAPIESPTFTGNVSITALKANNSVGASGQLLTSNGSAVYWSTVAAGGLTEIDRWHLTADTGTQTSSSVLTSLARSSTFFTKIGTGMSQASGIFTFPSTGTWEVTCQQLGLATYSGVGVSIEYSTNGGSSYSTASYSQNAQYGATAPASTIVASTVLTVTSTTDNKLRISAYGVSYQGEGSTFITFKKIA